MIPLLLAPPSGRPARVLGDGSEALPALRDLLRTGWPVVLHAPPGRGMLAALAGVQTAAHAPSQPSLRQASLVLITSACPPEWREAARRDLEGTGVPFWDEGDPAGSTLRFPVWFPGDSLSMAAWGPIQISQAWERGLAEELARHAEALYAGFLRLSSELRELLFATDSEDAFRRRVIDQVARPEILALLLKGEYEKAKMTAFKIVGSTTRELD